MSLATESAGSHEHANRPPFRPMAGSSQGIIHTDNPRLSYVNPKVVEQLGGQLRAQTAECVMDTFGISVNTWVKMRRGMPIRKSVAERLLQRVGVDL